MTATHHPCPWQMNRIIFSLILALGKNWSFKQSNTLTRRKRVIIENHFIRILIFFSRNSAVVDIGPVEKTALCWEPHKSRVIRATINSDDKDNPTTWKQSYLPTIVSISYQPLLNSIFVSLPKNALTLYQQRCDKIYDQMYLLLGSRPLSTSSALACLDAAIYLSAIYKLYGLSQKLISVCFNNFYKCADLIPATCTVWLSRILEHTESKLFL